MRKNRKTLKERHIWVRGRKKCIGKVEEEDKGM
jgi:hypothetical protein